MGGLGSAAALDLEFAPPEAALAKLRKILLTLLRHAREMNASSDEPADD